MTLVQSARNPKKKEGIQRELLSELLYGKCTIIINDDFYLKKVDEYAVQNRRL